ncbi:protein translocase subunit SecD [candidate division WOR-3 bacterium JGI_Cruoil_03_44_89]|uniref:Protein translocase subunit SecD n=1 Tax=candidate division WOR-3 bacterium JGI_Cruoil_03_44_89 TaxID=1973748 RepID=A0A235BUG1_UNCW3|nr:MAG: protein translocase subunit SecD [candidate division WOR-3 bacterium JGI_Cruoil_03_44_89]
MRSNLTWKFTVVIIAVGLSLWQLSYTIRNLSLTPEEKEELPEGYVKKMGKKALKLGLDLKGGMHIVLTVDRSKLPEGIGAKDARDRAMEIIRNRVDQFGVAEPQIARQGEDRIVIQLPGVVDRERAKEIIGKTALLEFKLVESPDNFEGILRNIDGIVYDYELKQVNYDSTLIPQNPFLSLVYSRKVAEYDLPTLKKYLSLEGVKSVIPKNIEFLFSKPRKEDAMKYRTLYILEKQAVLTGEALVDAKMGIGTAKNPTAARVDLTMKPEARRKWARITGANINRQIAIVLDGVVQSAPRVIERIATGNSMIEMPGADVKDAQDLALVLRAGALPAPLKTIEERTVGPTLGSDSVRKSAKAMLLGTILVLIFMAIYYRSCGLIADFAVMLNIFFLLALLSGLGATLTLPGIAGIVLIIGTSVDANVLIYERIREELTAGKTVRAAIGAGYGRAFRTILDANVTTLLMAIVLYYFGTGPIRGFAVVLSLGIICNFFTAIFITRLTLDYITSRPGVRGIAI